MGIRLDSPRLTDSTDDELVVRWREGDRRALDVLLERHRRLVRAKARSYFLVGADFDDVEQEGLIGLYKAVRDFHPMHGVAFRAFAELCITRQIITAIKAASRRKHEPLNQYVSLSAGRSGDDPSEHAFDRFVFAHHGSDPADRVVSSERMAAMHNALTTMLSALEVDVLTLYVQGRSYLEISEELGRQVKSIDNALQRVKTKLGSRGSERVRVEEGAHFHRQAIGPHAVVEERHRGDEAGVRHPLGGVDDVVEHMERVAGVADEESRHRELLQRLGVVGRRFLAQQAAQECDRGAVIGREDLA